MKKIVLFLLVITTHLYSKSQNTPPVQTPDIPEFHLLLMDSTVFSCSDLKSDTYTFIIHFSPDCEHCQKEINALLSNYFRFKDCQFILASPLSLPYIKEFSDKHQLNAYPNIITAFEPDWIFSKIFKIKYIPFVAIFDKQQQLLKTYTGESKIDDWLKFVQ